MSQIGTEHDNFGERRRVTILEEGQIDRHSFTSTWRNVASPKTAWLEKAIGLAILPLVAFWLLFSVMIGLGAFIAVSAFQLLGLVFRRRQR